MHTRTLFNNLVEILKYYKTLEYKVYSFEEIKLNNVLCNIEIYFNLKLLIIKCKNIFVIYNEQYNYKSKYIVHHFFFNNFDEIPIKLYDIYSNYSFFDGVLMTSMEKQKRITESKFFGSDFDKCSVCYDCTNEITTCNHCLCLNCRENMLSRQNYFCPICRKDNVLQYYNNKVSNCYNNKYPELNQILNLEILQNIDENIIQFDIDASPEFQMLMAREMINFNINHTLVMTFYIANKIYQNKMILAIMFGTTIVFYYSLGYTNSSCLSCDDII